MHESSLIADLVAKVESVARENSAAKVTAVEVSIGALAGIGVEHLQEHFRAETLGTIAEGAELHANVCEDPFAADSQGLLLRSVELEP